jgi:hypothetical protein
VTGSASVAPVLGNRQAPDSRQALGSRQGAPSRAYIKIVSSKRNDPGAATRIPHGWNDLQVCLAARLPEDALATPHRTVGAIATPHRPEDAHDR